MLPPPGNQANSKSDRGPFEPKGFGTRSRVERQRERESAQRWGRRATGEECAVAQRLPPTHSEAASSSIWGGQVQLSRLERLAPATLARQLGAKFGLTQLKPALSLSLSRGSPAGRLIWRQPVALSAAGEWPAQIDGPKIEQSALVPSLGLPGCWFRLAGEQTWNPFGRQSRAKSALSSPRSPRLILLLCQEQWRAQIRASESRFEAQLWSKSC